MKDIDTPKLPVYRADPWNLFDVYWGKWYCPNCDEEYLSGLDKFCECPKCRQKIVWDKGTTVVPRPVGAYK